MDADIYAISKDTPQELKMLKDALDERYDRSITFLSDPKFDLIDDMDMKNGDVAYRGYGLLDKDGNVVVKKVDDYWGENLDTTLKSINDELDKLK